MKVFKVLTKDGKEFTFNFPNSIKEIPDEYLTDITSCIEVADNYSLVGLCYTPVLSDMILTARTKNKSAKIKVTPIFIKAGNTDCQFIKNAKLKQRILTTQSQISIGVHVAIPNHKLTIDYFSNVISNCAEKEIYTKEIATGDRRECVFIEFKLLPNADIMGLLDMGDKKFKDLVNIEYIPQDKAGE